MTEKPPKARLPSANVRGLLSQTWQVFYDWLGITSGSLSDIPGNHIRVGYIFIERGQPVESLRRAKLALWMRPSSADAYALKALAHAWLDEKPEAQQALAEARRLGYLKLEELSAQMNDVAKQVEKAESPQAAEAVVPSSEGA